MVSQARIARCRLLVLLLAPLQALAAPPPAPAAAQRGVVTAVIDGDTVMFTPDDSGARRVRLADIDAPEICQGGGEASRRALAGLALNQRAVLRGGVLHVDDVVVNLRMVEDGMAYSIRTRYDRGPLVKQERMARALGRGLHAMPGMVMPWDFRKAHGPCAAK